MHLGPLEGVGEGVGAGVGAAAEARKALLPAGRKLSGAFLNPHLHGVLHLQGGGLQSPHEVDRSPFDRGITWVD